MADPAYRHKTIHSAGSRATLHREKIKTEPRKWASTPNNGSGLRGADGTISDDQRAGLPVKLADDGHDHDTPATARI